MRRLSDEKATLEEMLAEAEEAIRKTEIDAEARYMLEISKLRRLAGLSSAGKGGGRARTLLEGASDGASRVYLRGSEGLAVDHLEESLAKDWGAAIRVWRQRCLDLEDALDHLEAEARARIEEKRREELKAKEETEKVFSRVRTLEMRERQLSSEVRVLKDTLEVAEKAVVEAEGTFSAIDCHNLPFSHFTLFFFFFFGIGCPFSPFLFLFFKSSLVPVLFFLLSCLFWFVLWFHFTRFPRLLAK